MGDPLDDGTAGDERGSGLPRETVDDVLARLPRELAGSRAKVERARKHLDELHVAIEAIDPTQFYRMVRDDDADAGVSTWRFKILRELPDVWGVIIGEFGYKLRSSLDLAVHQLAVADSGAPGRKTAFPIFSDAQNYGGPTADVPRGRPRGASGNLRHPAAHERYGRMHGLPDRAAHRRPSRGGR